MKCKYCGKSYTPSDEWRVQYGCWYYVFCSRGCKNQWMWEHDGELRDAMARLWRDLKIEYPELKNIKIKNDGTKK